MKKNTDIGDFPVKKIPTVNENVTIDQTNSRGEYLQRRGIARKMLIRQIHNSKQRMINKIARQLED